MQDECSIVRLYIFARAMLGHYGSSLSEQIALGNQLKRGADQPFVIRRIKKDQVERFPPLGK